MIPRDLCDPAKTKHYSPLRMQFHFLLSRFYCWDGFIPLTRKEMAARLKCDVQSIDKFIKKGIQDKILRLEGDRLYFLQAVLNYTDGYVKHFPFLESPLFQSLQPHTQRFVLYCLWAGVHTGRPLKVLYKNIYHTTKEFKGTLNLYSRRNIATILQEAKQFVKLEVVVEQNGENVGKQMIRVTGLQDQYALQDALKNEGEMKNLLNLLADHGCDEIVSEENREELLKIKKHYFNRIGSLGSEMFFHAMQKLMVLQKLHELNSRGEVGPYFKTIMKDLESKIIPKLEKRIQYAKQAITQTKHLFWDKRNQIIEAFNQKKELLELWLHDLKSKKSKNDIESKPSKPFTFYNWLEDGSPS